MRPKRSDNKYWTGTRNFNHLQYESDLEDYISDLEVENEQLHKLGVMRPASASGNGRTVASEGREKHVRGGCIDRTRKKDGPCCYPVGTCDDCQIP